MTDRPQQQHHRDNHHQLREESRAILRHHCSHGSLNSSTSSNTSSNADPRPQTNSSDTSSEPEHDAQACLSCTRRNVISVFPRFRKVTTHLFSSFSRGHQSRASVGGGCPTESCIRAVAEGMGEGDPHARDLPALQVYPAQPTGAALCLGKWGLRSAASATNNNTIGSGGSSNRPADRVSHGDQVYIPLPAIPGRLARGCSLLKTTSHGAHTREFCLDIAQQRITWDSRKKKKLAHIDLERIVEIRVGERALWAVANEDCLPHGAKRLFAIIYYHQTVLKTICVVAQSDESYHEWLDTLTDLLSSRQPITSFAHFQRWRLICILRQWWEARQSGESATDSFHSVESMLHPASTATEPAPHPAPLSKAPPVEGIQNSSPLKASARKWLSGGGGPIRPTPSLPLPTTTTPPMLGRSAELSLKPQYSSAISLTSSSLQSRCSDESSMELVDALRLEHAQQSIEALYHDISLSLTNLSSLFADSSVSQFQIPSLCDSDNENENDADDDDESDQLTMAGSSGNSGIGLKRSYPPLRLALPRRHAFGLTQPLFARFLRETQKEPVTDAEVKRRFVAFTRPGQEIMTAYELEAYLLSAFNSVDCSIGDDDTSTVSRQDTAISNMDMPLNQYYISTSHNTYLIGDQIVGTSKVEGYVRALLRGCRCIEVDCWDGGYGEPVVSHGHTLTTRILFEDVIIAVSQYAFAVSPYPVILSFEMHCSLPQQARMATILKKHLGAMLVVAPIGGEQEYELPSPNQLKYRVIVKNKVLSTSTSSSNVHSSRPSSLIGSMSGSTAVAIATAAVLNSSAIPPQLGAAKGVSPRSSVAQLNRKVAPELSELIVYCKAVHFEGFEEGSEMEPAFDRVSSVSESTSNQQIRQHPKKYIDYNATQMTRVYPAFSRVTSTNFNPIGHWAAGCQLVALNFQTHDRNMQIYEAMFRRTPNFGYVLKPKHLREPASKATPQASEDGNDDSENKASPASASSLSSVSLQSSEREAGVSSPSSLVRCKTVHINVLSAYNATRGGPRRAAAATRAPEPMERRSSFVLDAGGISRTSTWLMVDPQSSSPKPLSRSPSDLAMFSFNSEAGSLAAVAATSDGDQSHNAAGGYPSLNAVATAAMSSLAAEHQKYAIAEQQGGSAAGSAIRVEIEWITEGAVSSTTGGTGSSAEDVALLASAISHLGHQQQLTGAGLSAIQSLCGTAPSSPVINPLGNGYPFHQTSFLCGTNLAATPKPALPMAPPTFTPAGGPAVGRGGSGSGRFVSRNGTLTGNSEVRWKDESLFRVVPEPELSFARLSLFEDDVEVASTCISVDALKEGYRFIELGQEEKSRMCRPVYLLLHVQVSQLHCLETPPAVRI